MRNLVAAALLIVGLAACGEAGTPAADAPAAVTEATMAAPPIEGRAADVEREEASPDATGGQATTPSQAAPAPILYLAYAYAMGLEVPSQRLTGVMEMHTSACQAAGVRQCQLIGANVSGDPDSYMEGYVSLRGEPAWLRTFMAGISAQVSAAGGRITSSTTNTEDLTRQIVDTEARLRAQTALRDRLQELLRSRPGRLADLLEVERELARVQGEIDAVQSSLAVMRTRVAMSELTIQYRSAPRPVGSDTFEPLRRALANFLGVVVSGFAAIIMIIAGLIPIAAVVVPIVWLALRWRRARGGRFFGSKPTAAARESADQDT